MSVRSTTSNTLLHPSDAIYSPPRFNSTTSVTSRKSRRNRSASRRRRDQHTTNPSSQWKKLLWVKQPFPDNYTDENTFLDHLQRNPKLRPYEFWPLVADSTIIVQHLCSVVIFVSCFTGINMGRIKPELVVGWATGCTVLGWIARDYWLRHNSRRHYSLEGEDEREQHRGRDVLRGEEAGEEEPPSSLSAAETPTTDIPTTLLSATDLPPPTHSHSRAHSRAPSATPSHSHSAPDSLPTHHPSFMPSYDPSTRPWSPRTTSLLATAKSAILIYCSLLGLSPILKSLTRSTSSDSIWAMSFWLIALNVFTFDYGADATSKFPASLSTNAALMASTVLASRLPSTTHVFSLTLFSIEVFGLFPVFRRHLRAVSWTGHLLLTIALVVVASGGLGMAVSGGGWVMGGVGVVLGSLVCLGGMGVTSWWLIGLQRYKNEIYGPWDPARPVIRGGWD